MLSYCLKCKKDTKSINLNVSKNSHGKIFLSKCVVCKSKKSRFIKEQDPSGLGMYKKEYF